MKLYDDHGYLNIDEIAAHKSWLKVIIGARQVGKTYGVLKYHLDHDISHILLRRTREEVDMISASPELNPYKVFEPEYRTGIFKTGKYNRICDYNEDGSQEKVRGLLLGLSQIAHIRGFNGREYQSIVYDEAIPEKGVIQRSTEGDSLLNAYTTINGNRELEGEPPCTLWLLGNSNDLSSPVLEALNLMDPIIKARTKKLEWIESGGALIVQPFSRIITDQRRDTALMQQIRADGDFYQMAIENEFSYDASPLINNRSVKFMTPLFSYDGFMYAWEDDRSIYICRTPHKNNAYEGAAWDRQQIVAHYLWLKRYYMEGLITFSDARLLTTFRQLFDIKY